MTSCHIKQKNESRLQDTVHLQLAFSVIPFFLLWSARQVKTKNWKRYIDVWVWVVINNCFATSIRPCSHLFIVWKFCSVDAQFRHASQNRLIFATDVNSLFGNVIVSRRLRFMTMIDWIDGHHCFQCVNRVKLSESEQVNKRNWRLYLLTFAELFGNRRTHIYSRKWAWWF